MATLEEQFGQNLALLSENSKGITELKYSMEEMKQAKSNFQTWKPEVDHRVADLEHAVNYLGERMEHFFGGKSKQAVTGEEIPSPHPHPDPDSDPKLASADKTAGSAHLGPSSPEVSSGPSGHRRETNHRSDGFGVVYTIPDSPLVTGAKTHHKLPRIYVDDDYAYCDPRVHACHHLSPGALPNYPFPSFDGSNLRLWVKKAASYFDVYSIDSHRWVKIVVMHFTGSAVLWLHTLRGGAESMKWDQFITAVYHKFEKDEHN